MNAYRTTIANIVLVTTGSDFFTLSKASWLFDFAGYKGAGASTHVVTYATQQAEGQTIQTASEILAGNSLPVVQRAPSYYPVATQGAECGAIVTTLGWADSNLVKGYEFANLATGVFFVSGVLNSSQTLSNDPFNPALGGVGFTAGSCWSGTYLSQMNPF